MGSGPREPVLGSSANQQVLRTEALVYERLGKCWGGVGGNSLSGSIAERHGGRGENLPAAVFRGGGGGTTPASLLSQSKINSS